MTTSVPTLHSESAQRGITVLSLADMAHVAGGGFFLTENPEPLGFILSEKPTPDAMGFILAE